MTIQQAEGFLVNLPLKEPFIVSYETYDSLPAVILKLTDDQGNIGWGESVPDALVTGETERSVFSSLRDIFVPLLMDTPESNLNLIHDLLDRALYRNGAAKAAIDIACLDLLGKRRRVSVGELLGGHLSTEVVIPQVISILEPEVMAEKALQAERQGYTDIKIKVGKDDGHDLERIRAVGKVLSPGTKLRVDANQGWDVPTALEIIQACSDIAVAWFEQPISADNVPGLAHIRQTTGRRIMADESVQDEASLLRVIECRAADFINLKLMKSGGIWPTRRLAQIANAFGLRVQLGSMPESIIGTAAGLHFATTTQGLVSSEMVGPDMLQEDLGTIQSFQIEKGAATLASDTSGLGVSIDEAKLREWSIETFTVSK